jgi:hypothetical protein
MEKNTNSTTKEEQDIIVFCPHCQDPILIEKLNCCIFRHGTLIASGKQIGSHSPKELCDFYVLRNKIYGCGKPFQIVRDEKDKLVAVVCGYI